MNNSNNVNFAPRLEEDENSSTRIPITTNDLLQEYKAEEGNSCDLLRKQISSQSDYPSFAIGSIELIIGPMFAGKTTELMRRIKREIHALRSCIVIKYSKDVRYSQDSVSSHDFIMLKANFSVSCLAEVGDEWKDYDVIAIDEGQFYPDLNEFAMHAADKGKTVYISALDGDYQRRPFGRICDLVPLCETVDKLSAICMLCRCRPASFTRRTIASDVTELIGGVGMYISTCRQCYNSTKHISPRKISAAQKRIQEMEENAYSAEGKLNAKDTTGKVTNETGVGKRNREEEYNEKRANVFWG